MMAGGWKLVGGEWWVADSYHVGQAVALADLDLLLAVGHAGRAVVGAEGLQLQA